MSDPDRDDPGDPKRALRRHMRAVRDSISEKARQAVGQALVTHADDLALAPGDVVSAFWPIGSEIDVTPLIHALYDRGMRIALPIATRGEPLHFRRWRPGDVLVPAAFGTFEPTAGAPPLVPGLLLVPLLAFTREGHRLGYGGGHYDRTLASLAAATGHPPRAIGVGYDCQEVGELPVEAHDVPLDAVLTETGLVVPAPAAAPNGRPAGGGHTDSEGSAPCA